MLRHAQVSALVLLVAFAVPFGASATLIVPVSQTRTASVSTAYPEAAPGSEDVSAPDFGSFDEMAMAASGTGPLAGIDVDQHHMSFFTDNSIRFHFQGDAAARSPDDLTGSFSTDALLDVTFDLTARSRFVLSADLEEPNVASLPVEVLAFSDDAGHVIVDQPGSGTLDAGRYRLLVSVHWEGPAPPSGDDGMYHLPGVLQFTAVPEPASAALLALGLALLATRRAHIA